MASHAHSAATIPRSGGIRHAAISALLKSSVRLRAGDYPVVAYPRARVELRQEPPQLEADLPPAVQPDLLPAVQPDLLLANLANRSSESESTAVIPVAIRRLHN